jgi:hypothetical protein
MIGIGWSLHILNNAIQSASDTLPIDLVAQIIFLRWEKT